jgi:hypothetical protein
LLKRGRIFLRAGNYENQKNNPANGEGLKRQRGASEDDREEAEDLQ